MKRFYFCISILIVGLQLGYSQSSEMAAGTFVASDSSVGKAPVYALALPAEISAMEANVGKSPFVISREGPPPRAAGPGLRFNTKQWFYVYTDPGAAPNHYAPSGWMGDFDDLTLDTDSRENPADGKTCIKITYSGESKDGAGWAGMYWQNPVNNWGDKVGGYNLKGMKQLTFWARGAQGGEMINEFKIGGIEGDRPDSDAIRMGPVILTSDWKQYVIDLSGADLSHISGGFSWSAAQEDNLHGMTFYLDEIRFER